ncbi:hypothetical protein DF19_14680 [Streptomyces olindensis]|nr:hypothetical protein DF19_14680 [Streptomyces olindensis]
MAGAVVAGVLAWAGTPAQARDGVLWGAATIAPGREGVVEGAGCATATCWSPTRGACGGPSAGVP